MASYSFRGKVWKYQGPSSWYFITLPKSISKKIRKDFGGDEEGWGRLKAVAKVKDTEWNTSIWFDIKRDSYLLPLKADVRKKEKIVDEMTLPVAIRFPKTQSKAGLILNRKKSNPKSSEKSTFKFKLFSNSRREK